ncbi:hypothetical protein LTR99_007913 [Exophiala xenobiotica]|uniref:Uncharacterized protein n=1 Tax=Vermiconidia calcicola TaxID=1690605 RepID=A0AAV9Q3H2_9PEZI|nr:hypothetical protein H2202_005822 [Exophiala xenobiotica]KAK5535116.1 hypothetical protein LTR25_006124 [Vermiconidia calcicola]KAK5535575.1 hypothetical protein LTR23_008313 [Chaetothyriales sp. CCFEE 6169]KAK5197543.1 hypothetical protein LTR92_003483 [Exophiala xenobiotica]KAK5209326.1 hypothetical protein LTR41_004862 [Exophiala xenobiotica]
MRTSVAIAAGLVAAVSAKTYSVTVTDDVTITSCGPTVTNCPYKPTSTADADSTETWGDWTTTTTSSKPVSPISTSTSSDPTWGDWTSTSSTPVAPVSTSTSSDPTWGDWTSTVTSSTPVAPVSTSSSALCPSYTATTPPAWFSLLPTSVISSISAEWTGAPPSDWCYWTYSTSSLSTSTPVSPVSTSSTPVAPVSTSTAPYWPAGTSSTPVAPASTGAVWSYTPSSPVSPATYTGAASANAGSFALAGLVAAAAVVMA